MDFKFSRTNVVRSITAAALLFSLAATPLLAAGLAQKELSPKEIATYANDLLQRRYPADGPGGAILIARGNTVLFRAARGEADIEKDVPLRPDSVFRIGSLTKQFSAAGLLRLVEAGKVKLDDPLSKYVPDYPGGEGISVLQLLNHTAGVTSYTAIPGYMNEPVRRDLTTAQMIDVFENEAPSFEPGSKWGYSNSGYVLVGAIIEAASGKPWHEYLKQELFEPLRMSHTGYALDPRLAGLQVKGYSYQGHDLVPARPISMTQPHAAGSLVSNLDDLVTWSRALHEGRVLKNATYAQMITPAGPAADPEVGYGFGLFTGTVRGNQTLEHGGGIFGFISSLSYLPGPDITVVVLENDDRDNDRTGGDSADTLARRLAAAALGDSYPEMRAVPIDAAVLREAEGVYQFADDVTRFLRVVDGKLTGQRGASGQRTVLTPIAADDFLYADGFNRIQIEREGGGRITNARFFPNGEGGGVIGTRTGEPLPALPVALQLPRPALERLVGTYAREQLTLKVHLEGDTLRGQLAGQPPVTLRATSPTEFEIEETKAMVIFSAGEGPAAEAIIKQNGRELPLKRIP